MLLSLILIISVTDSLPALSKTLQCGSSPQRYLKHLECDGIQHCLNGQDEENCGKIFLFAHAHLKSSIFEIL